MTMSGRCNCAPWLVLIVLLQSATAASNYQIETFSVTLTNPYIPDHDIPVYVYYPKATNSTEKFATIVFAHGFGCDASYYPWVYQNIVPLGYIVAYIDSFTGSSVNQTLYAIDQRYTLQWLYSAVNTDKSSPLYQRIDTTRALAAGHSEGGGCCIAATGSTYVDALFKHRYKFNSVFALSPCGDPGTATEAANIESNVSVFIFTASKDCICPSPDAHHIYNEIGTTVCKYYADVVNGTHCHWMDAPQLKESVCNDLEMDICQALYPHRNTTISETQQIRIAAYYMKLWLKATLGEVLDFGPLQNQLKIDEIMGVLSNLHSSNVCV